MIDTTKYYWNKELHTATAELANEKAATRNMQVSRWVNNSKGRQIVTYIVHTGERNDFASRQEGILFQVSEDAGRGGRIENEMNMLSAVIGYLNSLPEATSEAAADALYEMTGDDFDNSGVPMTAADVAEWVSQTWHSDDYDYAVTEFGDALVLVATAASEDVYRQPQDGRDWRETSTPNQWRLEIGTAVSTAAIAE
jgi:hypothetical protein